MPQPTGGGLAGAKRVLWMKPAYARLVQALRQAVDAMGWCGSFSPLPVGGVGS